MSKILNYKNSNECHTWRAPLLDVSEEDVFDYKLTESEKLTHRQQQQRIRQQAFEKSFAKGYMEGLERGQQEIREQTEYINSVMATLSMPLTDLDDQVVDEMAQLCIAISRQMIRRELKASPDEVVAVVKDALNALPNVSNEITLELHPSDAALIRNVMIEPDHEPNWRIVEDPVLTRGGCRVKTNNSRVDATVENRFNAVVVNVMGGERKQD